MITYVRGDATNPNGAGPKTIVHVSNNAGGWGAGFVLAVSRRWKEPEAYYRKAASTGLLLGTVQFVQVEPGLVVVNMIAQKGYGRRGALHRDEAEDADDFLPPIRYDALETCLGQVAVACVQNGSSVHAPRFGCGLAGGKWEEVEKIINRTLVRNGVPVTIYDL